MVTNQDKSDTAAREMVISRVLDAPPELVWQAFTDPEHIGHWWGPDGFTTTTHEIDIRPGGAWRLTMHGPDGRDYPNHIVFDEVAEPERLVYHHVSDDPEEACGRTTVTFEPQDGKTKLTMHKLFASPEHRERICREYGALVGGLQCIGRFAAHLAGTVGRSQASLTIALPSEREIVLYRVFDAPADLVFEAFSRPEHIRRWWGCGQLEMTLCEMDFRAGGQWRFVQRDGDGNEHPFRGQYLEIDRPARIVQTFIYDVEGIRDFPSTETITFQPSGGRTALTCNVEHESQQSRDAHLHSGMEGGANESMNRLADLVASLTPAIE